MSKCEFSFQTEETVEDVKNKIKIEIEKNGGSISFTESEGTFTISIPFMGAIRGGILFGDNTIYIKIDDKPFAVTCDKIKREIGLFI